VEHLVPVSVSEQTLVLGTDLLFSRGTVARVRKALSEVVRLPDEGYRTVNQIRIEQVWVGRDGAAPVLKPMPGGAVETGEVLTPPPVR
jgi:hypothetical protein